MTHKHESIKEERFTGVKEGFLAICTYIEKGKVKTNTCAAFLLNFYVNRHNDFVKKTHEDTIAMQSSTSYLEKCLLFIFSQKTIKEANKFLEFKNLITIHRTENNNIHESNYVSINLCAIQEAEKPYKETFIENAFYPQIRDGKLVYNSGGGLGKFTIGGGVNLPKGLGKFTHTNINTTIINEDKKESSVEDFSNFSNFEESEGIAKETSKSDFQNVVEVQPAAAISESDCIAWVSKNKKSYKEIKDACGGVVVESSTIARVTISVREWVRANVEAYNAIYLDCGHVGTKEDNTALVNTTIGFWLRSDNYKKAFISSPASFFAANYKKSLLYHLAKNKGTGLEIKCRDKNEVIELLRARYSTYNLQESAWHIEQLTKPLTAEKFEKTCEAFYKAAKAKAAKA